MKRLVFLLLVSLGPLAAQYTPAGFVPVTVAPSGSCSAIQKAELLPNGTLYTCQNGTWGVAGGGGGGGTSGFPTPVLSAGNTVLTVTIPAPGYVVGCNGVSNIIPAGTYSTTLASPAAATGGYYYGYYNCLTKPTVWDLDASYANFTGVTSTSGIVNASTGVSGPPISSAGTTGQYVQLFTAPAGATANQFNSTGLLVTASQSSVMPFSFTGASIIATTNPSTGAIVPELDPTQPINVTASGSSIAGYQAGSITPATSAGTPTLVAHTSFKPGLNGGTSSGLNTTGANFLIAAVCAFGGTLPAFSDSLGNYWRPLTTYSDSNSRGAILYAENAVVGSSQTFTATLSGSAPAVGIMAFSGMANYQSFQVGTDVGSGNSSTSISPGSITSLAPDLVVTMACNTGNNNTSATINGGFTIADQAASQSGVAVYMGDAYLIQSSTAASSPTWSGLVSGQQNSSIAAFSPQAAVPTFTGCESPGIANPTCGFDASGSTATTTGTITAGTNLLTVTGGTWTPGMGIAIAGASSSSGELVGNVMAVSGATLTLSVNAVTSVSGATVYHDDSAAIMNAASNSSTVHLPAGSYNVSCDYNSAALVFAVPTTIYGDGRNNTFLVSRCKNQPVLQYSYNCTATAINNGTCTQAGGLSNVSFVQSSSASPATGLYAVAFGSSISGNYLYGLHLSKLLLSGTGGIIAQPGILSAWVEDIDFNEVSVTPAITVNSPSPSGDIFWNNIMVYNNGNNATDISILQADTQEFDHVKINTGNLVIGAAVSSYTVYHLRFVDFSMENGATATFYGAGGGATTIYNLSFIGGACAYACGGFTDNGVKGLLMDGMTFEDATGGLALVGGTSTITGGNWDSSVAVDINMTGGAIATITGNIQHADESSGTNYFVQTDSSITSGLVMNGNLTVAPNNFNAASLVPANIIPALITPSSSSATCTAGRPPFYDSTYVYTCPATNTIVRALMTTF